MDDTQDKKSGGSANSNRAKPDKATIGSIAIRVFAFLLLAVLMFHEETRLESQKICSGEELPANQLSSADYQLITSLSSFRDPNDQLVRIVTLTSGIEPEQILNTNVCMQRAFLAKLVRKLKRSGAS